MTTAIIVCCLLLAIWLDRRLWRRAAYQKPKTEGCYGCGGPLEKKESFLLKQTLDYCPKCSAFMCHEEEKEAL